MGWIAGVLDRLSRLRSDSARIEQLQKQQDAFVREAEELQFCQEVADKLGSVEEIHASSKSCLS